jgi:hypothetical protein
VLFPSFDLDLRPAISGSICFFSVESVNPLLRSGVSVHLPMCVLF